MTIETGFVSDPTFSLEPDISADVPLAEEEHIIYTLFMGKDQSSDDIAIRRADIDAHGEQRVRFTDDEFKKVDREIRAEVAAMIAKDKEEAAQEDMAKVTTLREQIHALPQAPVPDNMRRLTPKSTPPLKVAIGKK